MTARLKNIIVTCVMAVFFIGTALVCVLKPESEYSLSERRELMSFPEVSAESIFSGKFMSEFNDYSLDQFPLRDQFRAIKAVSDFYVFGKLDNNDIYIHDGYAAAIEYPMSEDSILRAAGIFRQVYDKYFAGKDMNVYLSIIPDKNCVLSEDSGRLSMDYDKFVKIVRENTEFMEYIDIMGLLSKEDYYRTDTHWKQENIIDVADTIAGAMGVSISGEYDVNVLDIPFEGVYSGQSALPLKSDTIKYLTNDTIDGYVVYDYQNNTESDVYDMERAYGKDPYEMYLSGPISLMTIENPNATTDRELIVFRDSFGSSIAPLLAEGYAKVTLIDIRYIQSAFLDRFVEFENQDVLFLYSTLVLNNSTTLK